MNLLQRGGFNLIVLFAGNLLQHGGFNLMVLFAGNPPQCNAWVGQCGLYILVMVIEKLLMTLLVIPDFWRDVSQSRVSLKTMWAIKTCARTQSMNVTFVFPWADLLYSPIQKLVLRGGLEKVRNHGSESPLQCQKQHSGLHLALLCKHLQLADSDGFSC